MRALTFVLGIALATGGITACGSPAVPPDSSPPDVVLNAYLAALERGDCATAHALATSAFVVGNGELCGGRRRVGLYAAHHPGDSLRR